MANINTVTAVFQKMELKLAWTEVNLESNDHHNAYFIAYRRPALTNNDAYVNKDIVQKLVFEIALDSGVSDCPVIIDTFDINFDDCLNQDATLKGNVGFHKSLELLENFYIRLKAVETYDPKALNIADRNKIYSIYNPEPASGEENMGIGRKFDIDLNITSSKLV